MLTYEKQNWSKSRMIKSRKTSGDMERFWDHLDATLLRRISTIKNG